MTQAEIEAFLAIIKYGSISAAAKNLYVGQPTLSARIQSLENELSATLFTRGRGIRETRLTKEGQNFLPVAHKWLALFEETANSLSQAPKRPFVLAASLHIYSYVLPEIYLALSEKTRRLPLRLLSEHSDDIYTFLENNEIDAGLISSTHFSPGLVTTALYSEPMVLACNEASSYGDEVSPGELDLSRELYFDWNHDFQDWHRYWFGTQKSAGLSTNGAMIARYYLTIPENWCIIPASMALTLRKYGYLRTCRLTDPPKDKITFLLRKQEEIESVQLREILSLMPEIVKKFGGKWLYES